MFISGIALNEFTNLLNILFVIFFLQTITSFFISVLHGLLPLIKQAKATNKHFLKLTFISTVIAISVFINTPNIELYFGNEWKQILLALSLTLTTTLIIHFLHKHCSNADSELLAHAIKVFLIITIWLVFMKYEISDQTNQSLESLLLLSTYFFLPISISFLFSTILVIVDKKIPQTPFTINTSYRDDNRKHLITIAQIPVFILHVTLIKALNIPTIKKDHQ